MKFIPFTISIMPKNKKRIAIIGEGGEWSALSLVRELGQNGYICIGIFRSNNVIRHSKFTNAFFKLGNNLSEDEYIKKIKYILVRLKIDKIICLHDNTKELLMKNLEVFSSFNFLAPSIKSFNIALNKSSSIKFVEKLGIPVPKVYEIANYKQLSKLNFSNNNKYVIKGNRGVSSQNVRYALNSEEAIHKYKEINELDNYEYEEHFAPIVQKYIPGPTYLTQAICNKGKVLSVIPHYKFREWPITGGISCRAKTIVSDKLIQYSKRILEELKWHGEAGLEWKYDPIEEDFYFLEINPRFEGSLDIAIKSGVNLPLILIDIMNNISTVHNLIYKPDTHYRWFFRYDFKSFLYGKENFLNYIFESFNTEINGELSFNDFRIIKGFYKRPIKDIIERISNAQ